MKRISITTTGLLKFFSRRVRLIFWGILFAIIALGIYKIEIFSSTNPHNRDEWTSGQIYVAFRNKQQSSKRTLMGRIKYELFSLKKKWNDFLEAKKNYYPGLIIRESRDLGPSPLDGYLCGELTTIDEKMIIKKYKTNPFMFEVGDKINKSDVIGKLKNGGYNPTMGAYDDLDLEQVKDGFSFPCEDSKGGYAVFTQDEEIVHIRKIRDYQQYLVAWKNKRDYTAQGIYYFYLPSKVLHDSVPFSPHSLPVDKWTPEQITYAYISNKYPSFQQSIEYRNSILQKTLQEVFHKYYKDLTSSKKCSRCFHISVTTQDIKEIINEYGEQPFRLRFYDKINESFVFNNLEQAGYHPRVFSGVYGRGFCFSIKNSTEGYAIFIERGMITDIRKLWNYGHFLNAKEKGVGCNSQEYTAEGIFLIYLPDFSN